MSLARQLMIPSLSDVSDAALDHYWVGDTSSVSTLAANWSLTDGGLNASDPPGASAAVLYTGNGNNPCTLAADDQWGSVDIAAGYTAKIDLGDIGNTLTLHDGGNFTAAGGGEFDCGDGTISLINGDFDNSAQVVWTYGTSTLSMAGVGTLNSPNTKVLYNVSISSGATISCLDSTEIQGAMQVDGAIHVTGGKTLTVAGNAVFNDDLIGDGSEFYLDVTGTNVAHNATITNCNCTGVELDATDNCINGGGNWNVDFGVATDEGMPMVFAGLMGVA